MKKGSDKGPRNNLQKYKIQLDKEEQIIYQARASVDKGLLPKRWGQLIITNKKIIFLPQDGDIIENALSNPKEYHVEIKIDKVEGVVEKSRPNILNLGQTLGFIIQTQTGIHYHFDANQPERDNFIRVIQIQAGLKSP
jgi:hypothetical protein